MGEMKSALERALERAEGLGTLSPEEMRKRKEGEHILIGEGLAKRYLEHGFSGVLPEGISKYNGEEKSVVARAALSVLLQSIGLEDNDLSEKAIRGILDLKGDERIESTCQEIEGVLYEYHQAKQRCHQEKRAAIEKSVRESLHRRRISGSAVGEINTGTGEEWKRIVSELQSRFDGRLSKLKTSLFRLKTED
ncbi:MAG: hypothetical protein AAGB97_05025 [Dehalococcoidia bacterium]|nr:hypothetical protein [Chloroflexota bacterium]MBT9159650.1 hypothetical protein [Chloroflexota bacterium]MBT9161741.1 hypothetical protein [Chloroflexota bacterium]